MGSMGHTECPKDEVRDPKVLQLDFRYMVKEIGSLTSSIWWKRLAPEESAEETFSSRELFLSLGHQGVCLRGWNQNEIINACDHVPWPHCQPCWWHWSRFQQGALSLKELIHFLLSSWNTLNYLKDTFHRKPNCILFPLNLHGQRQSPTFHLRYPPPL